MSSDINVSKDNSYRTSVFPKYDINEMPSFDEKVPHNWEVLNDEFTFFNLICAPYIHRKVLPHPMVKLNDGTADLVV